MNELPYAIHLGELVGFDFTIENNIVNIFTQPGYSRGSFINCGGNELSLDENTIYGGTLSILNNKCYDISNELHNAIVIKNRGCINDNLNILCKNNFIDICPDKGNYGIDVDIVSGSNFNNVVIENNSFENCGIRINNTSNIKISNNIVKNSYQQGIYILLSEQTSILKEIYINNNIIKNSRYTGLYILSDVPNNLTNCYVFNNISIENVKEITGSSATDVNIRVVNFKNCYVYDNIFGGNNVDQNYPAYYASIENLYENNNTYYGIGSVNYSDIINHYGEIQSNIADPSGGTTIDAEARSTINNILDVLEKFKLMEE
jgi:parallel beta-helix repeat protein